MKKRILILMMTICFGTAGCSSLGELITLDQAAYNDASYVSLNPVPVQMQASDSKSFNVYNGNPYTLQLEFEEAATDSNRLPVNGDGGASLNAYAACLTLKVMF